MNDKITVQFIDSSTISGMFIAFALVFTAIYIGGNPEGFIDIRSILIVLGGTFFVTIACFSFPEVFGSMSATMRTIFYSSEESRNAAINAIEIAELSRKKGFLGLDLYPHLIQHNSFLKNGIEMIIDQVKPEEIIRFLENEQDSLAYRHAKSVSVLRKAAEISPSMGLIGTLIGLVQMLGNLSDTSTIGPAMAVALLTTFYGAILSYMLFSPLASKLERNTRNEILIANIYISAIKSISSKESPRKLEMLLNSILPPTKKVNYFALNKQG